jgi:diadenosine tetraphosphate (Ap4A) HIT family hydrolase
MLITNMSDQVLFPNEKVIVTDLFDIHQDWGVPIPGFFIVAPLRKIRSIAEFTDEEAVEFMKLVRRVRQGMNDVLGIKDVYLFQNEDTDSGLFHLWMIPRHAWMERFGRKIESVRPIINYAKENMLGEGVAEEVRGCVEKMKKYMTETEQSFNCC